MSFFSARPPSLFHLELLQVDELAYVYQKIGFQCLLETPPHIISYFPDLRAALLDADPTLDDFSGIAECMPPYDSIDDIRPSLLTVYRKVEISDVRASDAARYSLRLTLILLNLLTREFKNMIVSLFKAVTEYCDSVAGNIPTWGPVIILQEVL